MTATTEVIPKRGHKVKPSPTMGTDPELFLIAESGKVLPAESFCSREDMKEASNTIHPDNAAMELNPAPSDCLQTLNANIGWSLGRVRALMEKKGIKATVSLRPTEEINLADAEKYPTLVMFGCSPANVFRKGAVIPVTPRVDPRETASRSVGYHIHFGRNDNHSTRALTGTDNMLKLVQMCDILVGVPAVILERDERVVQRRKYIGYGRAGEFRVQPHGIEYRTLGSWPMIHPLWTYWANCSGRDAMAAVAFGWEKHFLNRINMEEVAKCINSNDLQMAMHIWNQIKEAVEEINTEIIGQSIYFSPKAFAAFEWILSNKAPYELVGLKKFDWDTWTSLHYNHTTGKETYYHSSVAAHIGFNSAITKFCKGFDFTKFNPKTKLEELYQK